jgi:hypothetical protein
MEDKNIHIHVEGTEEAAKGIGLLAKFLIPLVIVLAVGGIATAIVHFATIPADISTANSEAKVDSVRSSHEVNQINRAESAQERADKRVGAYPIPKVPTKLVLVSKNSCLSFESGYLDNGEFTGYIRNKCDRYFTFYQVYFSDYAPDGTIVQSGERNTSSLPNIGAHERAEVHSGVGDFGQGLDARVVTVKVTIGRSDY